MCNKSETIGKIASALVAFSGEVRSIEKDGTNPHFKSAYTTLDHMIDETKPILHKHGLTVMQFPGGDGDKVTVRTMILHSSGEWIESEALTLKAVKLDPQGAGSAITYARRYSYAAALSLSLGDDDDGNTSSQHPKTSYATTKKETDTNTQSSQQTQPTSQSSASTTTSNLISEPQIKLAHKLKSEKKISDDDYKRMVAEISGKQAKTNELTKKQASELITLLNNYVVADEPIVIPNDDDLPF